MKELNRTPPYILGLGFRGWGKERRNGQFNGDYFRGLRDETGMRRRKLLWGHIGANTRINSFIPQEQPVRFRVEGVQGGVEGYWF